MKNVLSFLACLIICAVLLQYRVANSGLSSSKPLKVTEWDAFGYYLYIPSIYLYHDYKELKWCDSIEQKYHLSWGRDIQVQQAPNGNYVNKYLGGIAIMQIPFFAIGHWAAEHYSYPRDGFSPPYQYALGFGIIFYCFIATLILRRVLLYYFSDFTTALTLILVCLATNFIQYAAVDNGQTHAYIFLLYASVLYATIQWHKSHRAGWALLTGILIGFATLSRPTEAIMLFIPLLWDTHNKEASQKKWAIVRQHKLHSVLAIAGGFIAIIPQLLYWKAVTGSFVYDVGSKWVFLNPWFRVLFGWEKGWFIYTPITVFFIAGLFFMKRWPFQKAVLTFCLLNIWIIIAWYDWQYGGSYSTRALVQSYPVFALPLAAFIAKISMLKWRYLFYTVAMYLLGVNLFQITQYCSSILHYREMNHKYYSHIYLNPSPSPLDMSLLDTQEFLSNETGYQKEILVSGEQEQKLHFTQNTQQEILQVPLNAFPAKKGEFWIKTEATIIAPDKLWQAALHAELRQGDSIKQTAIRLFNPVGERTHNYAFYISVSEYFKGSVLKLYIASPYDFEGSLTLLKVTALEK